MTRNCLRVMVWGMLVLAVGCGSRTSQPAAAAGAGDEAAAPPANSLPLDVALELGERVTLKLKLIPAGTFRMGNPSPAAARAGEAQHEVTITKAFYLGLTPVTVDQFAVFARDTSLVSEAEKHPQEYFGRNVYEGKWMGVRKCFWHKTGFGQAGDHPVVLVTWTEAQAFCTWLAAKSGRKVALPTEAQWEYASRAGTTTQYIWGDNPDEGQGWGNANDQSLEGTNGGPPGDRFHWNDGYVYTAPVQAFKPNAWGLYDMVGNVRQWCQDTVGRQPTTAVADPLVLDSPTPAGAPMGRKVQRGSSYIEGPSACRAWSRRADKPDKPDPFVGFRVAVAE